MKPEHEFERTVLRVLRRLPVEISRFAMDKCAFVAVGADVQGQTLPPNIDSWLIVLREEEDSDSIAAHEIAHAFFGHDMRDPALDVDRVERETREALRSWGFTGEGADEPITGSG